MTQISERLPVDVSSRRTRSVAATALRVLPVLDTVAVVVSLVVAHMLRFGMNADYVFSLSGRPVDYGMVTVVTAVLWAGALFVFRPREAIAFGRTDQDYRSVIRASGLVFTLYAFLTLLLQLEPSRAYLLFAFPVGTVLVLGSRWMLRRWVRSLRAEEAGRRNTMVIGTASEITRIQGNVRADEASGMRLVATCETDDDDAMVSDAQWLAGIRSRVESLGVIAVVVGSLPRSRRVGLRELSWELERSGVQVLLAPELESVTSSRIDLVQFAGTSMILVQQPRYTGEKYVYKRILDVLGAGLGLLLASPVILVAALAIWLQDGASPFFRQQRVGVDGNRFTMLKLRSMSVDADAAVAALSTSNEAEGPLFKMKHDPRVTPIGRFIRRYSIDELPQLWNVVRGDMSLVGPRPPLPRETEQYEDWAHRRLLVKPGLTGLWQVSGRSDLGWEEGLMIDLSYVENWSVIGDLQIIAKTVGAVFAQKGAY